jgi:hypothetical protein
MESFFVVLPSDSSESYFPLNTIANFRTKLATPIQLEPNKWEVGLVEISYPRGYKKQPLHNIVRLDTMDIKFPVKNYENLYELFVTLKRHFKSPEDKEKFVIKFNGYLNKHMPQNAYTTNTLGVCYGQNSLKVGEKIISHFPVRVYNGLEDLAATIMAPANCSANKVSLPETDNLNFAAPEPIYVYTDIIKPNLVGDSYVRMLTPLHFPSADGYHRFHFPLYRPVEQSFIESIAIRLVTKSGEDVTFDDSDIPCLITLHFKNKSSVQ